MAINIRKDILWRIYLVYLLVFIMAILIVSRVFKIQISEGDFWRQRANELTLRYANIEAMRGNIFDINGQLLATSLPYYDLAVDMNSDAITDEIFEANVDSLALCLSNLFADRTRLEFKRELVRARVTGDRYHILCKNVSYKELQLVKTFPLFRKGRFKGGLIYTQKGRRALPFKYLAARTIGYSTGNSQPVGLEGSYNNELTGISGKRLVRKIAGGIEMPVNDENEIEPQDGRDIVSTIDVNIQDVAHNALYEQLKKHQAGWGCVVLMEVKTGEIRAIANLTRMDSVRYAERYNYAIGHSTEPGSTFKLMSLMAAMEDGYFTLDDTVNTGNGKYKIFSQEVKDSHEGGHGTLTVKQVFEKSSNVGIVKLIYRNYANHPEKFIDRLYKMGVNLSPQLDIEGAALPDIKSVKDKRWSVYSLPWMSYGYEARLTPLQILTFYNAVANDGEMVKPRFVREVRRQGKTLKTFSPEVIHPRVASASSIRMAKSMMEGVVQEGTAKNLKHADYKIAGKTGTAQIAKAGGGYGQKNKSVTYQASFAGYFPADNPRYSCIVVVNAPSAGVYYANAVAGPIFKEIADKVYSTLLDMHSELNPFDSTATVSVPPVKNGSRKNLETVSRAISIPLSMKSSTAEYVNVTRKDSSAFVSDNAIREALSKRIMPDVTGMGLKDAIYLLENAGLRVRISGSGAIVKQSIKAGSKIYNGDEVMLELM